MKRAPSRRCGVSWPETFGWVQSFRVQLKVAVWRSLLIFLFTADFPLARGANLSLEWDRSPDVVSGYTLWYRRSTADGIPQGGSLQITKNVGDVTTGTLDGLVEGAAYRIFVTAYDESGIQSEPSNILIVTTSENRAPMVSQIADQEIAFGEKVDLFVTASDPDVGQKVRYTFEGNAPEGANLDSFTGKFTWEPAELLPPGVFDFTIIVTDDGVPQKSSSIPFRVNALFHRVEVEPQGLGSVKFMPSSPGDTYWEGKIVRIMAIPGPGQLFAGWLGEGDALTPENPLSMVVAANSIAKPKFTPAPEGMVALTVAPSDEGAVQVLPAEPGNVFPTGSSVTITAIPKPRFVFQNWMIDQEIVTNQNPLILSVDANHFVEPRFAPEFFELTIAEPELGVVSSYPASDDGKYPSGEMVELRAEPFPGFKFSGWRINEEMEALENPLSLLMDQDRHVTAEFSVAYYSLVVNSNAGGFLRTTPAIPANGFRYGTKVKIEAVSKPGYGFSHWDVSGSGVRFGNSIDLVMDQDLVVTPIFVTVPEGFVALEIQPVIAGGIEINPPNLGNVFPVGSIIQFTPIVGFAYRFANWRIDQTNTIANEALTLVMDRNHTVGMDLSQESFSVAMQPADHGEARLSPASPDGRYPHGSSVNLTAWPEPGWVFDGWTVDGFFRSHDNPFSLPIYGEAHVAPVFVPAPPGKVELVLLGSPMGTVQIDPGEEGKMFTLGSIVHLTASAKEGYVFVNWLVDQTNEVTGPSLDLIMDRNIAVEPRFMHTNYSLSIASGGLGNVVALPPSEDNLYPSMSQVQLVAVPDPSAMFSYWRINNGPPHHANPFSLTMDSNTVVAPKFIPTPEGFFGLNIVASKSGAVLIDPPSSDFIFTNGATVHLTAEPIEGIQLSGWLVDQNFALPDNPLTLVMSENHLVIPLFEERSLALAVGSSELGEVEVNPAGQGNQYSLGTIVELTAVPEAGMGFSHWTLMDGSIVKNNPLMVLMSHNQNVMPHFTNRFELIVAPNTAGTVEVSPTSTDGSYSFGTQVTLHATANSGYLFSHWSIDFGDASDGNPALLTMDRGHVVSPVYSEAFIIDLITNDFGAVDITPPSQEGLYPSRTIVQLSASPILGYVFSGWLVNGVAFEQNPLTLYMDRSAVVVPQFEPILFSLIIETNLAGTVEAAPPSANNQYQYGTFIELTALPNTGKIFSNWLVDQTIISPSNPLTLSMDRNHTVKASYSDQYFTLTIASDVLGAVELDPASPDHKYKYGTAVQIRAVPNAGQLFFNWLVDQTTTNTSNPLIVTMDQDRAVAPSYADQYFTLTVASNALGAVQITPSSPDHKYKYGTAVQIRAVPNVGQLFSDWLVDQTTTNLANPLTVTMDQDRAVAPSYADQYFTLTVASNALGGVQITPSSPDHKYKYGTAVQIRAVPNAGQLFSDWLIDQTTTNVANPLTVTMDQDRAVAPSYTDQYFTLTVASNALGTVQVSPSSPDHKYKYGTAVQIRAVPNVGQLFSDWLVDQTTTNLANPLTVTMDQDRAVAPSYVDQYFTLTVASNTLGAVQIAPSSPDHKYKYGTAVQIRAVPNAGQLFSDWLVDQTTTNLANPLTVTMDQDHAVAPSYADQYFTLTVASNALGTVQVSPSSPDHKYKYGTAVQIRAVPNVGQLFSDWLVDQTTTNLANPLTVTMDQDRAVAPSYADQYFTLTVASNALGTVQVIPSSPDHRYKYGTSVQLRALPHVGQLFSDWLVDQSVTNASNPLILTMDSDHTAGARFVDQFFRLTVISNALAVVEISPISPNNSYRYGSSVQLRAVPSIGHEFSSWLLDATHSSSNNPLTIVMDQDRMVAPQIVDQYFTLTITSHRSGTVEAVPSSVDQRYRYGTSVQLGALPHPGFIFLDWFIDQDREDDPSIIVLMDRDHTVKPNFGGAPIEVRMGPFGLVIEISGGESWTLQSSPDLEHWSEVTTGTGSGEILQALGEDFRYFRVQQNTTAAPSP